MSEIDKIHNRVMPAFHSKGDVMLNKYDMYYVLRQARFMDKAKESYEQYINKDIKQNEFLQQMLIIIAGCKAGDSDRQ
ncbi:hypothetical protein ACI2JA_03395 [Alkalihalobacillus sp. NPDC078783]